MAALIKAIGKLPAALRRSLTWDRGMELANHAQFTVAMTCRSTAAIPQVFGNVAATRIRMACSDSTIRKGWIYPMSAKLS